MRGFGAYNARDTAARDTAARHAGAVDIWPKRGIIIQRARRLRGRIPQKGELNAMADQMPFVPFGPYAVSRLVLGSNCINGGSHLSRFVNAQMRRYFTPERVLELLHHCQELGINLWQSVPGNLPYYQTFREQGGQMRFIALAREDPQDPTQLQRVVDGGGIGVAHHGETTDALFKRGEIRQAREYCKKIRDAGVLVGVSTHIPAVVDLVESEGWDVDFYMCCVYERHRTREELKALLGDVPLPVREVYLEGDPPRMFRAIRQTAKPCLAFKILAAGRLCDKPELVEQAFESTFRQIKPNDAVIVGIYPEYEDQAALDAEYVRRFSGLSVAP